MYALSGASVHYGPRSYPLNGLEREFGEISGADDPKLADLASAVGQITGFPREFKATHHPRLDVLDLLEEGRTSPEDAAYIRSLPEEKRVFPDRVVAMADGYTITWTKKPETRPEG